MVTEGMAGPGEATRVEYQYYTATNVSGRQCVYLEINKSSLLVVYLPVRA